MLLHGFATQSLAQTIWDGGGTDNNWNTAANWDNDTAPPNDGTDTLTFTGTTRTTPNVDTPWNLSTIAFGAGATSPFTISNQSITFSNLATLTNNTNAVTHALANDLIANTATLTVTANMGGFVLAGDIDLSTGGGAALTIGGAQDTDLSGIISGTGGNITKNDAGTLTLNGANTFDGPVTLNAGILSLNNNTALGSSTSLVIAGGNLQAGGAARTIADTVTVDINASFGITGTQNLTIDADVTLNASPTITVTNTANTTISGDISGAQPLTKAGTGSLELSGDNTYTGDTNINAGDLIVSGSVAGDVNVNTGGILAIGGDNALGGDLNINGGSTLQANGAARTITNSTTVTINGDFEVAGTQALEIASDITITGVRTINVTNTSNTELSGDIIGAGGGITKDGPGVLELSGSNTYDSDTILEDGTLRLSNDNALPAASTLTINGGAIQAGNAARVIPNTITLTVTDDFEVSGNENLEIASAFDLTDDRIITVSNSANTEFSGNITETGSQSLTKKGLGTLELSGTNGYTGGTNIDAGILIISGILAGPVDVDTGVLQLDGGTVNGDITLADATSTLSLSNDSILGGNLIIDRGTILATGGATTILAGVAVTVGGDFTIAGNQDLTIQSGMTLVAERVVSVSSTADTEFSGDITGSGGLTKAGSGSLELSGMNDYNGDTTLNAGALIISDTVDMSGGSGELIVNNDGALTLTGALTGDTFVNNTGDLTINGSGALTGDVTLNNAVTMTINGSGNVTGDIAHNSSATLAVNGSGTVTGNVTLNSTATLAVNNSATISGNTILNGGTLQIGNSSMFGGNLTINDGSTLQATSAARMIPTGVTVNVNGDFTISGTQDFTIESGLILTANREIETTNTGDTEFRGQITGTGSLTKTGFSTLELSHIGNSYSGGTTIDAGTLTVSGNLTGAGDVNVNNGGTLSITGSVDGNTFINSGGTLAITGSGSADGNTTLNTGGTLSIGNSASFGGDLAINGGTLQATDAPQTIPTGVTITVGGDFTVDGNQDLTIASGFSLAASQEITVNNTGDTVFEGDINGAGSLTKLGSRTLELAGANTYAGTNIDAGTLVLSGSVAGPTVVNSTGTLTGIGTVGGNLTVNSGGTLDAGPADNLTTGTLNIGGDLAINSGSITRVGVASAASADSYSVTGTVTIDPNNTLLNVVMLNGFVPTSGNNYTIITSTGITGDFDDDNIVSSPAGFQFETTTANGGNNLVLSISITPLVNSTVSANQAGVAAVLDNIRATVTPGSDMETAINQLALLSVDGLQTALDQIIPDEIGALSNISFANNNVQSVNVSNRLAEVRLGTTGHSARNLRLANLRQTLGDDDLMLLSQQTDPWMPSDSPLRRIVAPDYPWSTFISGTGTFGEIEADADQPGYEFTTGGITAGIDRQVSQNTIVGAMLGYALSNVDVDSNGGETDVNSIKAGLYSTVFVPGAYINTMIGTGINFYDTNRNINLGATTRTATSDPDGLEFTAMISAGFDFPLGNLTIEPIVSAQYTYLTIDGYTETGAGALNLTVEGQNVDSLLVRIGARFATTVELSHYRLIPEFRVFYQNELQEQGRSVTARFASGGGGAFSFNTTNIGASSYVIGAGLTLISQSDVAAYIDFNTETGRNRYASYTVRAGVQFSF